jgi:predicted nucleic acid-binding protein
VSGPGLTFDTGALIALERGERRMRAVSLDARRSGALITVPAPVLIEWWRNGPRQRAILEAVTVEPTSAVLAKLAGEAIAAVSGATPIDALVVASAAQRGDVVYTSDFGDLDRLRTHFPGVRVLSVSGPNFAISV